MAKLKMLKYPKKPKAGASLAVMQKYLDRRKEVDKENARRKAENKKKEDLRRKIQRL